MTPEDFEQKQYATSVCAGMNQRYHQSKASRWARFDRSFRIAVGVAAVGGAMMSVVTATTNGWGWDALSITIASIAAGIGVSLNVVPFGDWERQHVDYFRRWSDLREEVDALEFEIADKPTATQTARLKNLDAKANRICGLEPKADEKLLNECYESEVRSRQPDTLSLPEVSSASSDVAAITGTALEQAAAR